MNPSETILYPNSYYYDTAVWMTKSMSTLFNKDRRHLFRTWSDPLCRFSTAHASCTNVAEFSTDFECCLYKVIVRTLLNARVDDSVAIGTIVLLETLHNFSSYHANELPRYPDDIYITYFMGAFMLSHHLLCSEPPASTFWKHVLDPSGKLTSSQILEMERNMEWMLETMHSRHLCDDSEQSDSKSNMGSCVSQYRVATLPDNIHILPLAFTRMKADMYSFIRMRMMARGQKIFLPLFTTVVETENGPRKRRWVIADLEFNPCHSEMMDRWVMLDEVRSLIPELWGKDDGTVYSYLVDATGGHDSDAMFEMVSELKSVLSDL